MTIFDGITETRVSTDRYDANVLEREGEGTPVVFVHGNVSSSLFWQPNMLDLRVRSIAIDLRGFGTARPSPSMPPAACATSPTMSRVSLTRLVSRGHTSSAGRWVAVLSPSSCSTAPTSSSR